MSDSDRCVRETPGDGPENPAVKAEYGKDKIKPPKNRAAEVKDEVKSGKSGDLENPTFLWIINCQMYIKDKITESNSPAPKPKEDDKVKDPKWETDPAVKDKDAEKNSPDDAEKTRKSGKENVDGGEKDKSEHNKTGGKGDSKGTKNEEDKDKECRIFIEWVLPFLGRFRDKNWF